MEGHLRVFPFLVAAVLVVVGTGILALRPLQAPGPQDRGVAQTAQKGNPPQPARDPANNRPLSAETMASNHPASPTKTRPPKPRPPLPPGVKDVAAETHDAQGKEIPKPPPEFKGTALMWRVKFPMDSGDFESLMKTLRTQSVDERTSVLQKFRRSKDPELGRFMLEGLPNVPDNPVTIFDYAAALIEIAAVTPKERTLGHDGNALPDPRDETNAAIELLAQKVKQYHSVMNEQEWGGILKTIVRLRTVDPSMFEGDPGKHAFGVIRRNLDIELLKAADLRQGYLAGVDGFRLAQTVADEETHETLLRLLTKWETVKRRFADSVARPDIVALLYASRTLLAPPCPDHHNAAAQQLCLILASEGAPEGRKKLETFVRGLAESPSTPEDIRGVFAIAVGGDKQ